MSKVYILYKEELTNEYDKADVVAVFSSYAAMLLWLKEQWSFESDVEDQDELGAYFSDQHSMHGVQYMLFYQVHNLIGETSHRTGKMVVKSTQIFQGLKETKNEF